MGLITLSVGLLNMPFVQEHIKKIIIAELEKKLEVDISIEKLHFQPFNRIELNTVYLPDSQGETILLAEKIYAGIDLYGLVKRKIIISSLRIDNFTISLSQENNTSPLNIQFIIDAFKTEPDPDTEGYDFRINTVLLNNGNIAFDVKDKPCKQTTFDKNHISVTNLTSKLSLKSLKSDSLNIQVKNLSLQEETGLNIKNLSARLISQKNHFQIKSFKLDLPDSFIQLGKCEIDVDKIGNKTGNLSQKAIECEIIACRINPKDVAAFLPPLQYIDERLFLTADIYGNLKEIYLPSIHLDFGDILELKADMSLGNLSKTDSLFLDGKIDNLTFQSEKVEKIIYALSEGKVGIPKELSNLGKVSFNGNIRGHLDQLITKGQINSSLGAIATDLEFGFSPTPSIKSYFKGKVSTEKFELGKLLLKEEFNTLSFDLAIDLIQPIGKDIGGKAQGLIKNFDYKEYTYNNIQLNGFYDGRKAEGKFSMDDENLSFVLEGLVDLSDEEQPQLDLVANLERLRPDKLQLTDKYIDSNLSLNIHANFRGKDMDNAIGYIEIDSLNFRREENNLYLSKLLVEAYGEETNRKLKVTSNIVNGEITGSYTFSTLAKSLQKTFHSYLPALIADITATENKKIEETVNDLTLNFTINNTENLSNALSLPITILSETKIIGFYNTVYDKFRLEIFYPSGRIGGTKIQSVHLIADNADNKINAQIAGVVFGKNNIQNQIEANFAAQSDSLSSRITFTNDSKHNFSGDIFSTTHFYKDFDLPLVTDIHIHPSNLVINDSLWQFSKSQITLYEKLVDIPNFKIHSDNGNQYIHIHGKYSQWDEDEALIAELKDLDLEYIFNTLAIDALNFGGYATGFFNVASIQGQPYANTNLTVRDFQFNNTELGFLDLYSELDDGTKEVILRGKITDKDNHQTSVDGVIDPITQKLSIDFEADKVNIGFLHKYAETLFNNIKGQGSGKVKLSGDFSNVTVEGKAFIENGSMGINFLNTNYSFTDSVFMKKDLIYFNDITLYDPKGNTANVSGKVSHDYFTNFLYHVELAGEKFMLYNANESLNPIFYGTVYGTGTGSISGDEQVLNIDARLRTDENTLVTMNFMEETIDEYSFVTYKNTALQDSLNTAEASLPKENGNGNSEVIINMNFYVDATPDATVELVMDPVGGDVLRGNGSGAMQFRWSSDSDPSIYGTYIINKGNYNFTFQRILERKFGIQTGSSVSFRGDPFQATMDVTAIYKLVANLNDLDKNLAERTGQANVPVECILNISGELRHPNVGMDVALPSVDAEVQRQVKSLINSEDMVNRQMVYLLLLSKFYTPSYTNTENKTSDFAAVASATLSNQLSKILSMIDNRWQIGTNIRTSDAEFNSTEVELLLSSQLLNDRVLLNGNFGYKDNYDMPSAFISDIDIEVLLNRTGTWRLKVYNHYNEKYYYLKDGENQNPIQTQGLGIMYRKDFDSFEDLFGFKPKRLSSLYRNTIVPILPDSTVKGSSLGEFIKLK